MTPDRDPDHAVTAPDARHRCSACGRSGLIHLSLAEVLARHGYSSTKCVSCTLTDEPRPVAAKEDDPHG